MRGSAGSPSVAEPLAVHVEVLLAQVHLEVADHVGEHEAQQHDPADRHDPLLADRRAPEPHQEVALRVAGAGTGGPVYRASTSASSAPAFCAAVETSSSTFAMSRNVPVTAL